METILFYYNLKNSAFSKKRIIDRDWLVKVDVLLYGPYEHILQDRSQDL